MVPPLNFYPYALMLSKVLSFLSAIQNSRGSQKISFIYTTLDSDFCDAL